MILKPIYTLRERYTVMHSKLGISHCMSHAAYRNSLRSSSTRKPNYPEHYFYFLFYRYRFSNFSVINHFLPEFSVAHKSNVLKFYRIKFLMILPQVHLRKPCYDLSFLQIKRFKSISPTNARVLEFHLLIQSVGATGGVYKGQGRIHLELMTRYYKEFLVQNK